MRKKKKCGECGAIDYIFSKGRCKRCASIAYANKSKDKPVKKYTLSRKRHSTANKAKREGLGDFMVEQAGIILRDKKVCENCGIRLSGSISEVAHILAKSRSPEVMKEPSNILYLCSQFTYNTNGCHEKFDYSLSSREELPVFELAKKKIKNISEKVLNITKEYLHLQS